MAIAIEKPEIPVSYEAKFREYAIDLRDESSKLLLLFCPWCGTELPRSLRDRWFDELEKRGIDPASDPIPPEFMDERWYVEESL